MIVCLWAVKYKKVAYKIDVILIQIRCLLDIHKHIRTFTVTNNMGKMEIVNKPWLYIFFAGFQ